MFVTKLHWVGTHSGLPVFAERVSHDWCQFCKIRVADRWVTLELNVIGYGMNR